MEDWCDEVLIQYPLRSYNDIEVIEKISHQIHKYVHQRKDERLDKFLPPDVALVEHCDLILSDEVCEIVQTHLSTHWAARRVLRESHQVLSAASSSEEKIKLLIPIYFDFFHSLLSARYSLSHEEFILRKKLKYNALAYGYILFLVKSILCKEKHTFSGLSASVSSAERKKEIEIKREAIERRKAEAERLRLERERCARERIDAKQALAEERRVRDAKLRFQRKRSKRKEKISQILVGLDSSLNIHGVALRQNLKGAYFVNEYGAVEKDDRHSEVLRFLDSIGLLSELDEVGIYVM